MAEVLSIQVGKPKTLSWKGEIVTTSIFKDSAAGKLKVSRLNLEGDGQADLKVHGGPDKAVYAYPSEHYAYWASELEGPLPWGSFGENLTIRGLLEAGVNVGDKIQIGTVRLQVSQPRFPCYKLGIKFNDPQMVKRFSQARRNGFYLRVLEEGELKRGDQIVQVEKCSQGISISDFIELYLGTEESPDLAAKAYNSPGIPEEWKELFSNKPVG